MKKILTMLLLLTLCVGMIACNKEAEPTQAPAEAASEAPTETPTETTEATERKPIQAVNGSTPLSSGSGCATTPAEVAE